MNKKELENEIHQIVVNQKRKNEHKAKQKMYSSSTSFGREMGSKYTLQFADELKNRIEKTYRGRAVKRNFVEVLPIMLE